VRASDYLEEITWSFKKQKLRTFLTACGIGIGAFALALMVALGEGLESYIESQIKAFGNPRIVLVFPEVFKAGEKFMDQLNQFGKPAEPLTEEEETERKIRRSGMFITPEQAASVRALPGVRSIAPFINIDMDGIALVPEEGKDPRWYKVDFATLVSNPVMGSLTRGSLPAAVTTASTASADVIAPEVSEVVLAPQYARSFGVFTADDPSQGKARAGDASWILGREVLLRVPKLSNVASRFSFRDPTKYKDVKKIYRVRVVGLAEESPLSRVVYASLPLGQKIVRFQSQNEELLSEDKLGYQAIVRVADDADPKTVKAAIQKLGLVARSTEEELKTVSQVFLVIDSFLTVFGLIALFVATFGIVNTLLMAISERTREIGVMKALGATRSTIRRLFAAEAAAIGVVGGVGGVSFAFAVGQLANFIARRFPVAEALKGYSVFVFPWWLVLGAIVFATLIGTLAGIYPANRAARLDPIDALRYE
jgi:putative ABC transport system permease protein